MQAHIVIVSDQMLANLIPILMERPARVYLVSSSTMTERDLDRRLWKLLKQKGIESTIVGNAPDAGLRVIHEFGLQVAARVEEEMPSAEVVLNITGGNKLMSMGFAEVFRGLATRIIYTDTAHLCIEILPDETGGVPDPIPMQNVLDIPGYLAAQGFTYSTAQSDDIGWRERAAARKAGCKYLGRHCNEFQDLIGALNGLANHALAERDTLLYPSQRFKRRPWGNWADALAQLARDNVLDWRGGEDVDFLDSESARFCRGGWLEEYVWHVLRDESIVDTRLSVKGRWEAGEKQENEFDVLAIHGNQLLVVECKSLRHREESDSEIAYKVDSLGQDVRGLFGDTWLVSAREPTEVLKDRARQSRITLLGPASVSHLRDHVREWKRLRS